MKSLFVYADFDWMAFPELIGELSFDSVRGDESYGFSFSKEWLSKHGDIFLGEDLQNFTGIQYTRPGQDIFSCFSDALPDRWGRTLLNRREQIVARFFPFAPTIGTRVQIVPQLEFNSESLLFIFLMYCLGSVLSVNTSTTSTTEKYHSSFSLS